ncbi:MAG: DNA topoisomerase IV subunit A, partial [Alphaproteobacteria bacterium]|nr:DNA topoisomerase IV subunit A [Alphaproteobacteria bacterium]
MAKINDQIQDVQLEEALGTRYLNYALSTIVARSLPDVRDGLKPVHRRILYAMWESGNVSSKTHRKSASAVGYVMMKYHPHGDAAIYDSLVRMAQDFSLRYPLVDGQGNFGSIDGDRAAAMRYTEAKLSVAAESLLAGINENAIDFVPTYNSEGSEPKVLPSAFPNLLANGSTGIAVGMASNIPPHNISEICDALRDVIKNPNISVASLMKSMPGPDFPTGGIIVEPPESLTKTYETGRGSITVRARWEVESLKGGGYHIIITEIPYQIIKSRLIEQIAELIQAKKCPLLADLRDESSTDLRIVLMPKSKLVEPKILMEALFRLSDLESRFNVNLNVLNAASIPGVMNLKQILEAFLAHRMEVLERRSQFRLDQINNRLEILQGFMTAYLNIDEVIRIIRFDDHPKNKLMERFELSELQADAILNMRLRALRKLEEIEIREELEKLQLEKNALQELLENISMRWAHISDEIAAIKATYGAKHAFGKRKTTFEEAPTGIQVPVEAVVEREAITVICSEKGWIRALKGHGIEDAEVKYKDGDSQAYILHMETTDKLLILATSGRFYTIPADKIPGGRGFGEPIRLLVDLGEDDIVTMFKYTPGQPETKYVVAASDGRGFMVKDSDLIAQTKTGKQVLTVSHPMKAKKCLPIHGDMIAVVGENRKLLMFKISELPEMSKGRGVKLQFYRDGQLSDITTFDSKVGLTWQSGSRIRTEVDI